MVHTVHNISFVFVSGYERPLLEPFILFEFPKPIQTLMLVNVVTVGKKKQLSNKILYYKLPSLFAVVTFPKHPENKKP